MMEKFGLDPESFGEEAEGIWSMLNNLHETDPISYRNFVNQQMKEMNDFEAQQGQSCKNSDSSAVKQFIPEKGFVVKTFVVLPTIKNEDDGKNPKKIKKTMTQQPMTKKLFVNFCHHKIIAVPICNNHNVTYEDITKPIPDAQMPMVISKVRNFQDSNNQDARTVDIILNPWCIQKSQNDEMFKAQMITLGLKSIIEENNVMIHLNNWKLIKSSYKGGVVGPDGTTMNVHPFNVDPKMTRAKKNKISDSTCDETNGVRSDDDTSKGSSKMASIMENPQNLLHSLRSKDNDQDREETTQISLYKDDNKSNVSRSLIQEILEPKDHPKLIEEVTSSSIDPNDSSALPSKVVKQSKPLAKTMKGFLNKSRNGEYKAIYETPSSGDGMEGTGGSYARLMSKCQVVDAADMAHGKTSIPSCTTTNYNKTPAFAEGINKGFLKGERLYDDSDSSERGDFDAEFDDIMKRADPNFARTFNDKSETEMQMDELDNAIKNLANGMSRMSESYSQCKRYDPIQPDCSMDTNPVNEKQQNKRKISMEIIQESRDCLRLKFDLGNTEALSINDVSVEILNNEVTIKSSCGEKMMYHHKLINDSVEAKFKRKTKMLTLAFSNT